MSVNKSRKEKGAANRSASPQVNYLTTDHLGSPRIITDQNGTVTKRQDYSAFGEETFTAQRVGGLGYTVPDSIRQDYTGYQKDDESDWSSHRPDTTIRHTEDSHPSTR